MLQSILLSIQQRPGLYLLCIMGYGILAALAAFADHGDRLPDSPISSIEMNTGFTGTNPAYHDKQKTAVFRPCTYPCNISQHDKETFVHSGNTKAFIEIQGQRSYTQSDSLLLTHTSIDIVY